MSEVKFTETVWRKIKAEGVSPPPRRYHSSVLHDNKLWIFGGSKGKDSVLDDLWAYDFGANTWQEVSKKGKDVWPEARQGHSAVVFNGSMFLFGGLSQDNFTALQDMLYFDFTSVTWKQITGPNDQTPGPRCHHSCVLLEEKGKMLIMGGSLNLRSYHSDVWEFNLESFVWKKLDLELPSPRAGIMVLHDEKDKTLHLFGGYTGDGGFTYLNDAYELNLDVEWKFEKYEPKGTLPYTGRHLGAVYALECFWVFGGFDGKHAVSEFYYFDPKFKRWSPVSLWMEMDTTSIVNSAASNANTKITPRYGHTAVLDPNGNQITIFGGSGSMYLNDIVKIDLPDEASSI